MTERIKLSTPVKIVSLSKKFSADTVLTGIGSCFAQNVLDRFFTCGFSGVQNPTGIVYNAVSIAGAVRHVAEGIDFNPSDFFEYLDKWRSWEHHGSFAADSLEAAVEKANNALRHFSEALRSSGLFVVTPSSSVVYVHKESGTIVANCHKVPNHEFERRLLSFDENVRAFDSVVQNVMAVNPDCRIVFTLSPVRHYPGELTLNSVSKAGLRLALHRVCEAYPENVSYFPSYEIMMDELRDYRFYKDDMLHPSQLATDIIFNAFIDNYFTAEAGKTLEDGIKRGKASQHRARHTN